MCLNQGPLLIINIYNIQLIFNAEHVTAVDQVT